MNGVDVLEALAFGNLGKIGYTDEPLVGFVERVPPYHTSVEQVTSISQSVGKAVPVILTMVLHSLAVRGYLSLLQPLASGLPIYQTFRRKYVRRPKHGEAMPRSQSTCIGVPYHLTSVYIQSTMD